MQQFNVTKHRGIIIEILKSPLNQTTGYRIREESTEYIAHLGDVLSTEDLLYALRDHKDLPTLELETFKKGDEVEFEQFIKEHAIHVKKVG